MIIRDRELDHLHESFKPLVYKFLVTLMDNNIPVMVIETLRSEEAHNEDLKSGHSWIKHSKHQDGLAIDICPYYVFQLNGPDKLQWDASDEIWNKIGSIGEFCNLVWGGRWKQKDLGHFEFKGDL
jgi:hypothetical protein